SKAVLFYDQFQSVKPSDVPAEMFEALLGKESTRSFRLKSQFRVRGGNDYVRFVSDLMSGRLPARQVPRWRNEYAFKVFDRFGDLVSEIREKERDFGLSRLIAGYSWEWVSKKDPVRFDIRIEDVSLKWNTVEKDWINSSNA